MWDQHTVLATNTSALSVVGIGSGTTRLAEVIGIHGSPLAVPMSEIVKTIVTSDDTREQTKYFVVSLGLGFIVVPDVPGFMTNRVQMPYRLSAVRTLEAGIASRDEIDACINPKISGRQSK